MEKVYDVVPGLMVTAAAVISLAALTQKLTGRKDGRWKKKRFHKKGLTGELEEAKGKANR